MDRSLVEACFHEIKHREETPRNERMLDLHTEKEAASVALIGGRSKRT